jgi:hypothetical protein
LTSPVLLVPDTPPAPATPLIEQLRRLALSALARMYRPEQKLFAFRLRRRGDGIVLEGSSLRYTAIALIGLSRESGEYAAQVLHGHTPREVCERICDTVTSCSDLGAVALSHWAAIAHGSPGCHSMRRRLLELIDTGSPSTVGLSWALAALSEDESSVRGAAADACHRLLSAFDERSDLFHHHVGGSRWRHVASFADQIYPVHALSRYHIRFGEEDALRAASRCAARLCTLMSPGGQWPWHYDVRSGTVVERYPVYAVHQDAMAPMALLELAEAGDANHLDAIDRGLGWLQHAPELHGGSLIDEHEGLIWRKVGRHEPRKLVRGLQGMASWIHRPFRLPAVDRIFPPGRIDDECRPYHMGWLLYAWRNRSARMGPR